MKITNIKFSFAKKNRKSTKSDKELATFAIEFDNNLVAYRFKIVRDPEGHLRVSFPKLEQDRIEFVLVDGKYKEEGKPFLWFGDKEFAHNLITLSIHMYRDIIEEYNGNYNRRINDFHKNVTVESTKKKYNMNF